MLKPLFNCVQPIIVLLFCTIYPQGRHEMSRQRCTMNSTDPYGTISLCQAEINLIIPEIGKQIDRISEQITHLENQICPINGDPCSWSCIEDLQNSINNQSLAIANLETLNNNNSARILECCQNTSNAIILLDNKISLAQECCQLVTLSPITHDVVMDKNCDICPTEKIVIRDNITIDGQGGRITFTHEPTSQFIIEPGARVRFKNLTLCRINATTFDFGEKAQVLIGENVIFEFAEDSNWYEETFIIEGSVEQPNIFTVRSYGCPKTLSLMPRSTSSPRTISIGTNSLIIENINLAGIENIFIQENRVGSIIFTGSIVMAGCSSILIEQNTKAVFEIEGLNNIIRLSNDNLKLDGYLLFSDFFDSELFMQFRLSDPTPDGPRIQFSDNFLFLSSSLGRASLIFDDFLVRVYNHGPLAFTTQANAFLGGQTIFVEGFPINQLSNDLTLDSGLTLKTTLENAIRLDYVRAPSIRKPQRSHILTAFDLKKRLGASLPSTQKKQQPRNHRERQSASLKSE